MDHGPNGSPRSKPKDPEGHRKDGSRRTLEVRRGALVACGGSGKGGAAAVVCACGPAGPAGRAGRARARRGRREPSRTRFPASCPFPTPPPNEFAVVHATEKKRVAQGGRGGTGGGSSGHAGSRRRSCEDRDHGRAGCTRLRRACFNNGTARQHCSRKVQPNAPRRGQAVNTVVPNGGLLRQDQRQPSSGRPPASGLFLKV